MLSARAGGGAFVLLLGPRHGRGVGDLPVAQRVKDFEDLAPGGERPAVEAFVLVHGPHEIDLVVGVVALAGGGVDLPAAFALLPAVHPAPSLDGDRDGLLPAVGAGAAVGAAAVGDQDFGIGG